MKLVEILAKELGEWPLDTACYSQDGNGLAYPYINTPTWNGSYWSGSPDYDDNAEVLRDIVTATDHATAIVTREMWQAERNKQSCERVEGVAAEHLACIAKDSCNVILMRDRIREIDATIEAMTAERAELVSKLAGEGFALIVQTAESV